MRILSLTTTLLLAATTLLAAPASAADSNTFVTSTTPVTALAGAVGICAYRDLYNNMGGPGSECDGVLCLGYANGDWDRCVLDCTVDQCPRLPPPPQQGLASTSSSQAAVCLAGDAYNTGSLPCAGLACYGRSQYAWQTCIGKPVCVPPRCHIPPPTTTAQADGAQVALCVYGDAYNTGGRPCQGAVCVGYTMGRWVDCYPRLPCWTCPTDRIV